MSRLQTNAIRHLGSTVDNLTLDNAGRVLLPQQPGVTAYKYSFTQGGSAWNEVTGYGGTQGAGSSNFNASTGRFTCPVAGRYLMTANQRTNDGSGQDNAARLQLWLNGANMMNSDFWAAYAASYGGAVRGTVCASLVVTCAANDTLSLATYVGAQVMTHQFSVAFLG